MHKCCTWTLLRLYAFLINDMFLDILVSTRLTSNTTIVNIPNQLLQQDIRIKGEISNYTKDTSFLHPFKMDIGKQVAI